MTSLPWTRLTVDPEQALVLAIARAFAVGEDACATRDVLANMVPSIRSWDRVDLLLHVHRIKALTYSVVREPAIRDSGVIPDQTFGHLRAWYSDSFARTVMEPAVLHRLTAEFERAGIRALAIKGLILGTWLYNDPALREHDDMDFVVPFNMRSQVDDLLVDLGYGSGYRPPLYPGESPGMASYVDPSGGIAVDLSFDPLYVFWQSAAERLNSFDGWWSRRQDVQVGSGFVPAPGPEDQLLQLARHLQFHGYFRANWAIDVILLIRRFGSVIDWELVSAEAANHGITGGIERSLDVLISVYGFPLPDSALSSLRTSRVVRSLHRRVWPDSLSIPRERIVREQEGTPIAPRFLSPGGVHPIAGLSLFALDPRRAKYFRYLGQRVLPPPSWLREMYGEGSYHELLRQHWGGLRALRRRVRSRTNHLDVK